MAKTKSSEVSCQPMRETLRYYATNATEYVRRTSQANLFGLYERFLPLLPSAAQILDIGCGSGRDMLAFKERGFDCLGIDPVAEFVKFSQEYSGCKAVLASVENMHFNQQFDGVWACASLLHLPRNRLPFALQNIKDALRSDGILFLSMQEGNSEGFVPDGRYFSRYSSAELCSQVRSAGFTQLDLWTTTDTLSGREDLVWINILAKKQV